MRLACLLLLLLAGFAAAEVFIAGNDTRIVPLGRWDRTDVAAGPRFGWSHSGFRAAFSGPSVAVQLTAAWSAANVWYVATVDGADVVHNGPAADGGWLNVSGLRSESTHEIEVVRRAEVGSGPTRFGGMVLADGYNAVAAPTHSRRLEFIGDSISCGYGVLGENYSCNWSVDTLDPTHSYAHLVAKNFTAELFLSCWSGIGIIRNYGNAGASEKPMPYRYNFTILEQYATLWDFSYHPHAFVINLGTNDWSSPSSGWVTDAEFIGAYASFMDVLHAFHPTSHIFCACGASTRCCNDVQAAVAQHNASHGGGLTHYIQLPSLDMYTDLGCDWHPNVAGQRKMAAAVVPALSQVLGWEPGSSGDPVDSHQGGGGDDDGGSVASIATTLFASFAAFPFVLLSAAAAAI